MLDEYKKIYEESANLIPNWKELSKNDLAELYIQHEAEEISNSYFSGLILKFWNLIPHYYYKQGIKYASEDECYNWIVEGITKALNQRSWKIEGNKLYGDIKGPEKAIVVCIMSIRANFYQYTKYAKHSLNYSSLSLNLLEENSSDGFYLQYIDKYLNLQEYIKDTVREKFLRHEFFYSWFLDILFNFNLVVENKIDLSYNVNIGKFQKSLKAIDNEYLISFSKLYELDIEDVKKSFFILKNTPTYIIHANINNILNDLKKDEVLHSLLKER